MRGGTCPLLAASLDFQLLHVVVSVLLRVDGWPQSGGDCMAASYTAGKKGGVKFKHIQVWREQKSLQNNATCSSRKPLFTQACSSMRVRRQCFHFGVNYSLIKHLSTHINHSPKAIPVAQYTRGGQSHPLKSQRMELRVWSV